jgi:IS5 family transposase
LELEESIPDHTTLWLFRASLAQVKLTERLVTAFHALLREAGYAARAGQIKIIGASFVTVPRQRMRRKERKSDGGESIHRKRRKILLLEVPGL